MTLFARAVASFLAVSLAGGTAVGQASGNTVRIDQSPRVAGSAAITTLDIDQQVDGGNAIGQATSVGSGTTGSTTVDMDQPAIILGSLDNLRVNQAGTENVLGLGLTLNDDLAGTNSVELDYSGNDNLHKLLIGGQPDSGGGTRLSDLSYSLDLDGSGNTISDNIRGAAGLVYTGVVAGSNNTISTQGGSPLGAEININYNLEPTSDNNVVSVRLGTATNTTFDIDIEVDGSNNNISYQNQFGNSAVGTFDGDYTGSDITSTVTQSGTNAIANVTLTKTGAGVFNHTVSQSGDNTSAFMTLTALGAGAFTLNQVSDTALFNGVMSIADLGTHTVDQ